MRVEEEGGEDTGIKGRDGGGGRRREGRTHA